MQNYIITRTGKIDYLQFNKLLEFQDHLFHAIFLGRHNVGFNLLNDIEKRKDTIKKIENHFNIDQSWMVQSVQTHSDNIKELNNDTVEENVLNNYDAFICNKPKNASIISFADCIPIFIYDCKQNIYANIHSGWRGVVNQISIKTIDRLISKYNCDISNLICCIGPNIRKECFLVNDDLVKIYNKTFPEIIKHNLIIENTDLYNEKGKQYRIDNNELIETLLKNRGILEKNIINCGICTVCNSKDFHSCRAEGKNFQKNGGMMMLKKK